MGIIVILIKGYDEIQHCYLYRNSKGFSLLKLISMIIGCSFTVTIGMNAEIGKLFL
jgi:hypothetical protein